MKILLAVDGSQFSDETARMVAQRIRPDGAELCVLHVAESWLAFDYELGEVRPLEASHEEGAKHGKEFVERIKGVMTEAGFATTTAIEEGDPRFAIIEFAGKWKAELLVVGSHGQSGLGRLFLGSVADYVARHALCSVLIVRVQATA